MKNSSHGKKRTQNTEKSNNNSFYAWQHNVFNEPEAHRAKKLFVLHAYFPWRLFVT